MSDPLMDLPEPARSELITISTVIMPRARAVLERNGAVLPFAVELKADGTPGMLMTGMAEGKEQSPAASREVLREMLRRKAAEEGVRAGAIAFDTKSLDPEADVAVDAVCIHLEHVDGHAVDVFVPFKKGWFGYSYRNSFLLEAPTRIFASPPAGVVHVAEGPR
jgi:hypothetical protein